jgi:hypothetical protein
MDKSQCQQLVEEHLYSMSRFMSICEWTITASSEPKSSNKKFMRAARVDSRLDYLTATITLNPEAYQDDDDFLDSLSTSTARRPGKRPQTVPTTASIASIPTRWSG